MSEDKLHLILNVRFQSRPTVHHSSVNLDRSQHPMTSMSWINI